MRSQTTMPRPVTGRACGMVFFSILLLFLSGCSTLPGTSLPPGVSARKLGKSATDSPLAWSPDGRRVALTRDGLTIVDLEGGGSVPLDGGKPVAIAWETGGERLVAAFAAGDESILRLYGQGDRFKETRVAGRVEELFWPVSGEVVAVAHKIVRYSFGANVSGFLYLWGGGDQPPVAKKLFDSTLKPRTLDAMEKGRWPFLKADLSPQGDRLLYGQLHDPPVFTPYASLVLHQLETGEEKLIRNVALPAAGGLFSHQPGTLLVPDGQAETFRLDPASGEVLLHWPWPGHSLATAPAADRLLIDGHLLLGVREIGTFPPETEGWFSPDGKNLLVRRAGRLVLISGL